MRCDETEYLHSSVRNLLTAQYGIVPFDLRFNATHWAMDAADLCNEVEFSIAWMRAFARLSSECDEPDRHKAESHVSYYADNAVTRISSCRDKLALLAWSFYCPFNPEKKSEVLSFESIHERLTFPIKFGLRLEGQEEFLAKLNKLDDSNFEQAITYRHKKVHRMEPRVMLRRPENSDNLSYMFALLTKADVRKREGKLSKEYNDDNTQSADGDSCSLDGVFFERRAPDQSLWYIEEFDKFTHSCWKNLCDAAAGSCKILLAREPLL